MSMRPASSWPWLDDVLVEAGAFDDDPIVAPDTAHDPGSLLAGWLDAIDLDESPEVDLGSFVEAFGELPNADDPFHFEVVSVSGGAPEVVSGQIEPIAAVFLDAIESAPGFVVEDWATDGVVALATPAAEPAEAPGSSSLLGDHGAFLPFGDLVESPVLDPTLGPPSDLDGDTVDDTGGDLDDFDGVDGLDDFDGL